MSFRTCAYISYVKHLLILASAFTSCISVSAFTSLVAVPLGITSSAVELRICGITTGIKKRKKISQLSRERRRNIIK